MSYLSLILLVAVSPMGVCLGRKPCQMFQEFRGIGLLKLHLGLTSLYSPTTEVSVVIFKLAC